MKKTLTIILCAVLVCTLFAACKGEVTPEETSESSSLSQATELTSTTEKETETSTTEASTTTETTTKESYPFIKKGTWYLYYKNKRAYAFTFTSDTKVDIAFFDSSNLDGFDAKYFTTSETYEVENSTIIVPDPISMKDGDTITLTVKGKKLYEGEIELEHEKEESLDYPFEHYNGGA